ncbi:class I SAM-dependent methyltransferase [Variovorax sp. GB1P17]|uniref:class I SAM-dependent methyltransferase n=1 Tax=Variovorax sp. GB1P17 TaxID=3443740 RepID=UPI003F476EC2
MLNFTGERFIPTETGEIRYEHMHRYGWAQSLCAGRHVLDIACGEGYGSALLAHVASSVVGVDISNEAVAHARQRYAAQTNLRFMQGSATAIPLEDASVDVAVSFETLEHLAEQEEMLGELRRVLKPSGILIISSPNKKVYSDERNYVNEFHVKELYFDELDALLHRFFPANRYFAQRFLTASALFPLEGIPAEGYEALLLAGGELKAQTQSADRAMYFVAICAASEDLLPLLGANLFAEAGNDLYGEQQKVMNWASGLHKEHSQLEARYVALQKEFEERSAWALSMSAERAAWDEARAKSDAECRRLEASLACQTAKSEAILNSRSWRLLAPLRWVRRVLTRS